MMKPNIRIYNDDCLNILSTLEPNSVDSIVCDLPYFGVVADEFDNQWSTLDEYLA